MSQPKNGEMNVVPAPTSPSTSVSSYLARMEYAINPAASANVDRLTAQLSVTQSREKHNDADDTHGKNDANDAATSSVVEEDHSFNDRDDEDDGAIVLHRSVESLGSDGYLSTVRDDTLHRHHRVIDRSDLDQSYPSSAQIMAAVRESGNSSTIVQQVTPPTWVSYPNLFPILPEPYPNLLLT